MQVEAKNIFLGLDLDTQLHLLGKDRFIDALNITKDATQVGNNDMGVVNIVGNQLVNYALPAGRNKIIGAFGHNTRNTVIYFLWNENGFHSVLEYNNTTRSVAKIFISKTDSGGSDILGLLENVKVNSVNVLAKTDGDLVFFLDSLRRPTVMNITKMKANAYNPVVRENIDVGKLWPSIPPLVSYANDTTRRVNNNRTRFFRFKTRWTYDDNYKTCCSPISRVVVPTNILNDAYTNVITNNNQINVTLTSGDKQVKEIELLVSYVNKSNEWSDFALVKSFNKATESIANNMAFTYAFYNDGTYVPIDVEESILLFDYLPDVASAQEMPNGNVLAYAGITEGYDKLLATNVTLTIGTTNAGSVGTVGTLVGAVLNQTVGSSFYHVRIQFSGLPATGTQIFIKARLEETGLMVNIAQYTTAAGNTTNDITSYINGHILQPFVTVEAVTSTYIDLALRRSYYEPIDPDPDAPNTSGHFAEVEIITPASSGPLENNSLPTWKWSSERRIAIAYFDKRGKTNGVLYDAKVTFPAYAENGSHEPLIPTLNVKIYHQPPVWADSYQFLINKDNDNYIYWHTVSVIGDNDYLYWEVTNFDLNASKKPTTKEVLSYSFQDGDRMRLIKKISDQTIYADTYDGNIEGVVVDPTISGVQKKGKFVKIRSVAPFAGNDFSSGNYIIELYHPSQNKPTKENEAFFEFGERYAIINPTLSTRRHAGGVTDQSADLTTTPAETNLNSGDAYFRVRNIYITETGFGKFFVVDKNIVDFYSSAVSSIDGRPNVIDVNAKRDYYPTLIRFGQTYQQNTNINGLNRFYPGNFDEYTYSFGDVVRLILHGKYLYVLQKLKVGAVPIFNQITKDSNGGNISVVTDRLLNPIQYYSEELGIGDAAESVVLINNYLYGVDNIKGIVWRLAGNGLTPISVLYKVNSWASVELLKRTGNYKIYGAFNQKTNQYIIAIEAVGGSVAQTLVFDEKNNVFESFVSYKPEYMVTIGNLLISFNAGGLYTHDSLNYNTFYGVTYDSYVLPVFNENPLQRKTFLALSQIAAETWDCPLLFTNVESYAGQRQESELISQDFAVLESSPCASILRDKNSQGGLLNGDTMKGNILGIKLRRKTPTTLSSLKAVILKFINSPLN